MALSIRGFSFNKKLNSTQRPNISDGAQRLCVFKTPTSIINPTVIVTGWDDRWNYATIGSDIERWYYVTDVKHLNNEQCEVTLSVDVLATYRPEIFNTEAYVLRSSVRRNVDIADSFYPTKAGQLQKKNSAQFMPLVNPGFILSVMGIDQNAVSTFTGAVTYYIMTETSLASLIKFIFNEENFTEEVTDKVVKTFFNPSQYLVSCMYCPFVSGGMGDSIKIGWWDTGIPAAKAGSAPIQIDTVTLTIPRPDTRTEHYLNYEPYAHYRLYIPFVGMQELSSNLLKGDSAIAISGYVDVPTGNMQLKVTGSDTGRIIATYEANCCASMPLAQSSLQLNTFSAITGAVSIAGDYLGGSFGESVNDILDTVQSAQKQVSINGNAGQMSQREFDSTATIICDYFMQVDKDNSEHGAPLCESVILSELSGGYVKTLKAHFTSERATLTEINEIDNYLNGGVILE